MVYTVSMNKSLLLKVGTLVFLLILVVWVWFAGRRNANVTQPVLTNVEYTNLNITFNNQSGGVVKTENFLANPNVLPDTHNQGLYVLDGSAVVSPAQHYTITYEKKIGFFNVVLLQKPLSSSRQEAELYLKTMLGIDNAAMCHLYYMVSVPGYVDVPASGIDYRFSFCPGSITLP
jgi:hypothetical protein